jgi:hypothetical protein
MNSTTERKPESFDWVTARAACSLARVFEKLKLQIQDDIKARNALRPPGAHYAFSVVEGGSKAFSVLVEGKNVHVSVRFDLDDEKISVYSKDGVTFTGTVTLCDDGECRVKIGDQEHDLWQVRKMALEDLFFRAY